MNTNSHLTFRNTRILLALCAMFLTLVQSCDLFQEDSLSDDKVALLDQNEFYILPNSSAVIDLASVVSASEEIEVSIGSDPARGKLTRLGETLLQYEPSSQFASGSDHFKIDLFRHGKPLRSDSIHIIVGHDTTQFPCRLFAVEDAAATAINTPVSVPFLDNDRLCGNEKKSLEKEIFMPPAHGMAAIIGNSIVYTPEAEFEGEDSLVYKISVRREKSYALVKIHVGEDTCRIHLEDDSFTFAVSDSTSNTFDFVVISNDLLCAADSAGNEITILDAPEHGVLTSVGFGHFQYILLDSAAQDSLDMFRYRICNNGDCDEATVTLQFIQEACNFHAVDDVVYLTDSISVGIVSIRVLDNDMLCDSLTSLTVIEGPYQGTTYPAIDRIDYQSDSTGFFGDSLRYRVCVANSVPACREATVRIYRK